MSHILLGWMLSQQVFVVLQGVRNYDPLRLFINGVRFYNYKWKPIKSQQIKSFFLYMHVHGNEHESELYL